jgi:alpha-L-fucosidase
VDFQQDEFRVRFTGLPQKPPDDPVTVIEAQCDSEPAQDMDYVRRQRPREGV